MHLAAFPKHIDDLSNPKYLAFEIIFAIDILLTFITDIYIPNRTGGLIKVESVGEIGYHYWSSRRLMWDLIPIMPL